MAEQVPEMVEMVAQCKIDTRYGEMALCVLIAEGIMALDRRHPRLITRSSSDALSFANQAIATALAAYDSPLREALSAVREACLFADDDGQSGVTADPHISEELFQCICAALAQPQEKADG